MATIIIDVVDQGVQAAMNRLAECVSPQSFMPVLGEDMLTRVKGNFQTSTDPAGNPWAKNSEVTIMRYLMKTSGNFTKKGKLSSKGAARVMGKKPLIGESLFLSGNVFYQVESDGLFLGTPAPYGAVQQYGAAKGAFGTDKAGHPLPWGDIPDRPWLPVLPDGNLYPEERDRILALLGATIQQSVGGQQT